MIALAAHEAGVGILIGEIVRGESVPALWIFLSISGTLVVGLVITAIATALYYRPKQIFSGG